MSAADKIKNAAEGLAGKAKEAIGTHNGDQDTVTEGQHDQKKASAKKVGEDIKDVFK